LGGSSLDITTAAMDFQHQAQTLQPMCLNYQVLADMQNDQTHMAASQYSINTWVIAVIAIGGASILVMLLMCIVCTGRTGAKAKKAWTERMQRPLLAEDSQSDSGSDQEQSNTPSDELRSSVARSVVGNISPPLLVSLSASPAAAAAAVGANRSRDLERDRAMQVEALTRRRVGMGTAQTVEEEKEAPVIIPTPAAAAGTVAVPLLLPHHRVVLPPPSHRSVSYDPHSRSDHLSVYSGHNELEAAVEESMSESRSGSESNSSPPSSSGYAGADSDTNSRSVVPHPQQQQHAQHIAGNVINSAMPLPHISAGQSGDTNPQQWRTTATRPTLPLSASLSQLQSQSQSASSASATVSASEADSPSAHSESISDYRINIHSSPE